MNIKGTTTEENIKAAFAGESQARNKYTYYALQARQEGNESVAALFEKMAENEKEHAKIWFRLLHEGLGDVKNNLRDAAEGESFEWTSMYPDFAKQAREDGLEQVAMMFDKVGAIEKLHEKKFLETLIATVKGAAESRAAEKKPLEEKTMYRCAFCGHVEAVRPDVCPLCEAIGSFEEIQVSE